MMVAVSVNQTANWLKLVVFGGLVSFIYGCVLDTINRVPVIGVHLLHPLPCRSGLPPERLFFWSLPWTLQQFSIKKRHPSGGVGAVKRTAIRIYEINSIASLYCFINGAPG